MCCITSCDSVIYNIIMHVVIFGTVVPLFYHLQRNNEYFSTISFLIACQILCFLVQLGLVKTNWPEAFVYGSLSHVFGVAAILLLLRLISPVLAMRTCIPILVWVGITFIYQIVSCLCRAIELDAKANAANRDLVWILMYKFEISFCCFLYGLFIYTFVSCSTKKDLSNLG